MRREISFSQLVDELGSLLAPSLAEDWPNMPIERAKGSYVYDVEGKAYLDFVSGMASCNLGHCHPRVEEAARKQMEKLVHGPSGVFAYESMVRLAYELAEVMPGDIDCFFFSNSGAEAVEGALKLARYVTGRPAIIAFYGGFHGRTMGCVSLTTSKSAYRKNYHPLVDGIYHVPFPYCYRCPYGHTRAACGLECLEAVERVFAHLVPAEDVAAILLEPIQGEGGYVVPPEEFLRGLRGICDRHGILLIFDEVQTGFGRTGKMFAAHTFGVVPDIMAIAKGIANGFPLSATAAPRDLMKKWLAGSHGTTFGGNPVSCAAALAVLEAFREEKILKGVGHLSEICFAELEAMKDEFPVIGDVRGRGLMIGIEFVGPDGAPNPGACQDVLDAALAKGLLMYPCGNKGQVIRFIPPLTVSEAELRRGLDILRRSIEEVRR